MADTTKQAFTWSVELGRELLAGVSDDVLWRHWRQPVAAADQHTPVSLAGLRGELLAWAESDREVRHWILQLWRQTHTDVVAAVDHAVTEGIANHSAHMLSEFAADEVLLALLADEFDDGAMLAHSFVSRIANEDQRHAMLARLQVLLGKQVLPPEIQGRVVILGGNSRDESRLRRRLLEWRPLDVRWKTFEKKQGGAVEREVVHALHSADAAIFITGSASHILVQLAKNCAERFGVAWTCIERASTQQLTAALHRLFPELTGMHWKHASEA